MGDGSAVGAGLAVLASKEVLNKLLGPTAEYVGGEMKNFVEKCNVNIGNIFARAIRRLGPRLEEPGTVSPRMLRHVLDEGRFCEDEVAAEYFGGVLASSRSGNPRDDRGVPILAAIKDLSVYELRQHYLLYKMVKTLFDGKPLKLLMDRDRKRMGVYIPAHVYVKAMGFSDPERLNLSTILVHSVAGLVRRDLIDPHYAYGPTDVLKSEYAEADDTGLSCRLRRSVPKSSCGSTDIRTCPLETYSSLR